MPWIMVILAVLLFLPIVPQLNPSFCIDDWTSYGNSDAPGASQMVRATERVSLLPSGQVCGEVIVHGRHKTLDHRSWLPPMAVVLALIVFLVGWIRPPNKSWRDLAIALTAPAVMLGLLMLLILGDQGSVPEWMAQVCFAALAFIALGLLPACVTYLVASTVREDLSHRLAWFFASWAAWSSAIGLVFAAANVS